jgi:hypothetical protein
LTAQKQVVKIQKQFISTFMSPQIQKIQDFWKGNKSKILSVAFFVVLIIPAILMPKLLEPPVPQIVGTLDFAENIPTKVQGPNFSEYIPSFPNFDEETPSIKASPKFELPNLDNFVNEKKLEAKRDLEILKENLTPNKFSGKITLDQNQKSGITSDKFAVGTFVRISANNKFSFRKVENRKILNSDVVGVVGADVFAELGYNPDQISEISVTVEQS